MTYSRLKCPFCAADFGQEARFLDHLTKIHSITDHLSCYLEHVYHAPHPRCACSPDCPEPVTWNGWKKGFTSRFVRGHNARIDSSFNDPEVTKRAVARRLEGYATGKYTAWNKGLSKETDVRVATSAAHISKSLRQGYASGSIVDWRATDPEKAHAAAIKQRASKRVLFETGELVPWNKGLTKHVNASLARASANISATVIMNPSSSARRFSALELTILIEASLKDGHLTLLTDPNEYRNKYQRLQFQCTVCGLKQDKNLMMLLATPKCFGCHPKESRGQLELLKFVRSLGVEALSNDRTVLAPKELDVFVPSHSFGIEYDGLYWHSEGMVGKEHAEEKAEACERANVRLLRIFEDEWRDKRPIVEAMVRHRLGMCTERTGARQCELVPLEAPARRAFIEANHLEGDVRSSAAWGLIDGKGTLVAALSVRRPFHASQASRVEVARFCLAAGRSVPGALGRLSKVAVTWAHERGFIGLMTYVDRRIGAASGYVRAGFVPVRRTRPRFWWTDYLSRYDRFSVRADASRGITQAQAAQDARVVPIWGCGNAVLELNVPT